MTHVSGLPLAAAGLLVFWAACASSGAGGRRVEITLSDNGCSPTTVAVTPGEKLNLVVKNISGSDAYELEGIDGATLEEVVVHEEKTLSVGYDVPPGSARTESNATSPRDHRRSLSWSPVTAPPSPRRAPAQSLRLARVRLSPAAKPPAHLSA